MASKPRCAPLAGARDGEPDPRDLEDLFSAKAGAGPAESLRNLYQHYLDIQPRNEDLDITGNHTNGEADTTPQKHLTIAAGANDTFRLKARRGYVVYLSAFRLERENAAGGGGNMTNIELEVFVSGRQIAWLPGRTDFKRPLMIDRDDELVAKISNNTAGEVRFHVFCEGFARRVVPVLQPDRSGGRS